MQLSDVTLREAGQMPGRSYSVEQKVRAADRLDDLGVPYVQVGFPVTGERDREATARAADRLDAAVVGLARAVIGDVTAALEAESDVVEVFAPASDSQLEHVLDASREEMTRQLLEAVDYARDHGATVHVSLVDAFRMEPDQLVSLVDALPDVPFVNLPDTVGARTPRSTRAFLESLADDVDLGRVGVHFHDDLGVAVANTLAARELGVGKADVSVASLGERAGNAALEQVVAASVLESDEALGLHAEELVPACRDVLATLAEELDARAPVLGEEVVTHEAGIHTAAMLDEPSAFEPFDPARFGGRRRLVFGQGTGRGGARKLLERAGVDPTDERVATFLELLETEGPLKEAAAVELAEQTFDGR